MLAFDARAARAVRHADGLRLLLLRTLDLHSVEEVVEIVGCYFPDEPLSGRSRQLIADLLVGD